jgi:rhamnogalacturonyl hydrolase YesR
LTTTYLFASDDEIVVKRIADRIIASHSVGYIDKDTKVIYEQTKDIPSGASVYFKSPTMDWHYSLGVLDMAMVRAGKYFNRPRYIQFAVDQIDYALDNYRFFEKRIGAEGHGPFHFLWKHRELDHCGTESAAMLDVLSVYPSKEYKEYINKTLVHVMEVQERLSDATFVRSWPYPNTLWADDLYMGLSFLTRMYAYSGEERFLDDAIIQVRNFNKYLWNPSKELFYHAWYDDLQTVGGAHWGRCNGWIMLATTLLLDVMPEKHFDRHEMERYLVRHIQGIARWQSVSGMWHQLIDKSDSYPESSCTAIFTYSVARAINKGWFDKRYASIALEGWKALLRDKITEDGILKDVCVGTGIGNDLLFYYNRPVKDNEVHGMGLIIEAGIEIIELKKNLKE